LIRFAVIEMGDPVGIQRALANGDDYAVSGNQLVTAFDFRKRTIIIFDEITEDDTIINDFNRLEVILEIHALQLRIAKLILTSHDGFAQREAGNFASSIT